MAGLERVSIGGDIRTIYSRSSPKGVSSRHQQSPTSIKMFIPIIIRGIARDWGPAMDWIALQFVPFSEDAIMGTTQARIGIVPGIIDDEILNKSHCSMLLI